MAVARLLVAWAAGGLLALPSEASTPATCASMLGSCGAGWVDKPGVDANTTCTGEACEKAECCKEICQGDWQTSMCPTYCTSSLAGKCCAHKGVKAKFMIPNWGGATKGLTAHAHAFHACTGGEVIWGDKPSKGAWPDEIETDIGTGDEPGPGLYDGYFLKSTWFPTYAERLETLNSRVRDAPEVQWMDLNLQARQLVTFGGQVKGLPYEADFTHLLVRDDLLVQHAVGLREALNLTEAQWDPSSLPQTWEDLAVMAEYFQGKDLNGDGAPDYGLCWPVQDYAWVFHFYGIFATKFQYKGSSDSVFFDLDTLEPLVDNVAFRAALRLFRRLIHAGHTPDLGRNSLKESNLLFGAGRCAFYQAKRGGLKYIAIKKVKQGDWQPTRPSGEYWAPRRTKTPGSTEVFDRATRQMLPCALEDPPPEGHVFCPFVDEATDVLRPGDRIPGVHAPVVNRAPFFGPGVLAGTIRVDAPADAKDLLFDFITYTNVADQSTKYVAEISTRDTFRRSQAEDSQYFVATAGWGLQEYQQMRDVVAWGLSPRANAAMDLRVRRSKDYQYSGAGYLLKALIQYSLPVPDGNCSTGKTCDSFLEKPGAGECALMFASDSKSCLLNPSVRARVTDAAACVSSVAPCGGLKGEDETVAYIAQSWDALSREAGRLRQMETLRTDLALPPLPKRALCAHFKDEAEAATPGICEQKTCLPGSYRTGDPSDPCAVCPAGRFSERPNMPECDPCQIGRYQPSQNSSSCAQCARNATTRLLGASEAGSCTCPAGTLRWRFEDWCTPCPEGSVCDGVGPVVAAAGFMVPAGAADAQQVYRCGQKSHCPGGGPGACVGARIGVPCAECPPGYANSPYSDDCVECGGSQAALFAIGVLLLLVGVVVLHKALNRPMAPVLTSLYATMCAVSMVAGLFQQLGLFNELRVPWPMEFRRISSASTMMVADFDVIGLGCTGVRAALPKYMTSVLFFPVMLAVMGLCFAGSHAAHALVPSVQPWERTHVANTALSFLQLCFITMTGTCAVPFACYEHPAGDLSVARFPEVFCGQSVHGSMAGLAGALMILPVSFFALALYLSYSLPGKLSRGEDFWLAGGKWLIEKYNIDTWWWGCVVLVKSLLLSMVPVMAPSSAPIQIVLVVVILIVSVGTQLAWRPWRAPLLNLADAFLHMVLIVLCVVAVPFFPEMSDDDKQGFGWGLFAVLVTTYACLGLVFLVCAFSMVKMGPRGPVAPVFNFLSRRDPQDVSQVLRGLAKDLDADSVEQATRRMTHYDTVAVAQFIDVLLGAGVVRDHGDGSLAVAQRLRLPSLRTGGPAAKEPPAPHQGDEPAAGA